MPLLTRTCHVDRSFERSGRRSFARCIELNISCGRNSRDGAACFMRLRALHLRMPPQTHADAGRYTKARGRQRPETAVRDSLPHDFVLVPVGVTNLKAGSRR